MNNLSGVDSLVNRYFALRHGESRANQDQVILSDPRDGTRSGGLTAWGQEQVRATLLAALQEGLFSAPPAIYASDFLRARATAAIAADLLGTSYTPVTCLRERFFGEWDRTADVNYEIVWADDAVDPHHEHNGVESAEDVLERTTAFIIDLEHTHRGKDIILVSHGDTLHILQTAFHRLSPAYHRSLPAMDLAELRELRLAPLTPRLPPHPR